jgi:23S rRNA (cytidine1920-2'-O)/16S rRNA (cytidine1409-2'-O)-methyltransferase
MAGGVRVDNQVVDKPGKRVSYHAGIRISRLQPAYVSRGGLKLQKAIDHFGIDVTGKVAIDVGASTGGFTDCLLQNGAAFVYAVDVGYGQLDWKLRRDERVTVLERTNIRYVRPEQFPPYIPSACGGDIGGGIDLATIDVSFISLDKVVPVVISLLRMDGQVIALIKPQFEAERHNVGKGGVVKNPDIHLTVIQNICDLAARMGLTVKGLTYSPIRGPAGNIEYLIWLQKENDTGCSMEESRIQYSVSSIQNVISEAHATFAN